MPNKSNYALVLIQAEPAFLQKEITGTSGRSYGYAAWDDKREAHVLRIPEDVYLVGAGLDIARNMAHVGNYVAYYEAAGDEAAQRAEVDRLTEELEEARLNQRDAVSIETLDSASAALVELAAEPNANTSITRAELAALGKSGGGFRKLRKFALDHGVPGVEALNKNDALLEAIANHLKLT